MRSGREQACRSKSAPASPVYRPPSCARRPSGRTSRRLAGQRPRTMHAYEKGIIWGNDNYLIQSALVDLVLATLQRRWPTRHRRRAHGWPSGRLHAPAASDRREDLRRPGAHQGQRPHDDLVGLQQLPDEQQLAAAARGRAQAQPDRQGGDLEGARSDCASSWSTSIYEATKKGGLFVASRSTCIRRRWPRLLT